MVRVFADEFNREDRSCFLRDADFHHLSRVLRVRPPEPMAVVLPDGVVEGPLARMEATARRLVLADFRGRDKIIPRPAIHILQVIPNTRRKFEEVLSKNCEVGVQAFTPVISPKTPTTLPERVMRRWREIVRGAARQAQLDYLPELNSPLNLAEVSALCFAPNLWILMPRADRSLTSVLKKTPDSVETLFLLIGPEGGLRPEWIGGLIDAGAAAVRLNHGVLRTENAAFAASILIRNQ